MSNLDFLDGLGESSSRYTSLNISSDDDKIVSYLEVLVSRGVMMDDFKTELLRLYLSRKINSKVLFENIDKSINAHELIEYKLIDIDESKFKKNDSTKEYVGAIDRLPGDRYKISSDRGKISYEFAKFLLLHLKGRIMNIKMMNNLCDALDCDVKAIFKKEILTANVITS